ncbi:MAG: PAS domain-containing protein [Alphaproteobacteria bacterium]|nr:PAS domain-containing protein [Alphaproteobacteria bacterium]MBV9905860.1 PAS domain-containing protein [Alphaproteobacteria bacterium]
MDSTQTYWTGVARFLWPALAGLAAGGALVWWKGEETLWIIAGTVALAALLVTYIAREGRLHLQEQAAQIGTKAEVLLTPVAQEVLAHLPDPLMLLDAEGRVLFANTAMYDVIGVAPERKHVSLLLRTPAVLEAIQHTTESGEDSSVEFSMPVPVARSYQAYTARLRVRPPVTTLLLHDLTAIKRTEQMRVDFVANASHELRTPLAAVAGFIDTLKGHARDDAQARDRFLDIMAVEAGRMRRLIEDLLSLTRIELNEHVRPSGSVSLEGIVREAVAALSPLAQIDAIKLEISAAPNLPNIAGDRDELIQLFQNLIHNAIKYGKQGGHVWIALQPAPGFSGRGANAMIAASIRDDGEGIAADAIPRLTERFYRVDVKRSREKGGTGLGLAIVKHIVNRHQGKLAIESKSGEGSTFTVTLPVVPDAAEAGVTEVT